MRITTWNINSVRLRIGLALKLLDQSRPDVLCLQETKCPDEQFPFEAFRDIGYKYIAVNGMKAYNGVALISRVPFESELALDWTERSDCRHISGVFPGDIEIHNFYVPAGGDEPDIERNDKFAHKLDFMSEMTDWFSSNRKKSDKLVLVGDLNIAPFESDVWSHKQLIKVVSHTPIETLSLTRLQETLNWIDTTRLIHPEPKKLYSWWSYRARDWSTSDRGRRLDHIWVTPPLKSYIGEAYILREARGWEKPSDHVPVTTKLDLD